MKRTSRCNFGNQFICALAALTIALLVTIEVHGQKEGPQKSSASSPQVILTSHDTPPPVTLMDGSFIVEIELADFGEKEELSGQSKKYRVLPTVPGKKLYLAHIKVVDGSGELLYRGDYHNPDGGGYHF